MTFSETSGGTVRSLDLKIVVKPFPSPSQFTAVKLTHFSSKPQRPSDSWRPWPRILLRRCTPGPWPHYKVSMSGGCSQCHKSLGELFMQSLFQLGRFNVFWLLLFAFQSMFISIWVSRLEIAEFPDSVRRSAP